MSDRYNAFAKPGEDMFTVLTPQNIGIVKKPIYIYNVGPMEHKISSPPNIPHMLVRACPENQEYLQVGSLEHPFTETRWDQNGNAFTTEINGYEVATKLLSPMNPGLDQNFSEPDPLVRGGNYNEYGVFWSVSNPPTEQELRAARARLERSFRNELIKLNEEERKNPQTFQEMVNNFSHLAADYFQETTTWHRTDYKRKEVFGEMECPECGESIKKIAKKCRFCNYRLDEQRAQAPASPAPASPAQSEEVVDKMAKMREAKRLKQLATA